MEAGASGYLTKDSAEEEIITAIRRVNAGERYIAAEIARSLALQAVNRNSNAGGSPFDQLSAREMQVMIMATGGHSVQDISDKLHLSPKTVSTYRSRLFEKLGVGNDVELMRLALRYGVIEEKTSGGPGVS
jgi:two-component system invasion response regulator UvrY